MIGISYFSHCRTYMNRRLATLKQCKQSLFIQNNPVKIINTPKIDSEKLRQTLNKQVVPFKTNPDTSSEIDFRLEDGITHVSEDLDSLLNHLMMTMLNKLIDNRTKYARLIGVILRYKEGIQHTNKLHTDFGLFKTAAYSTHPSTKTIVGIKAGDNYFLEVGRRLSNQIIIFPQELYPSPQKYDLLNNLDKFKTISGLTFDQYELLDHINRNNFKWVHKAQTPSSASDYQTISLHLISSRK